MDDLEGKVAVVTGAASGIGLGLAQAFAEEGMKLVLADIDDGYLETARASLAEAGAEVLAVRTDVADAKALDNLRDSTFERFGTAHVLCNNAGIGARSPLVEPLEISAWDRVFGVDLYSILHGLNAFLPRMLEQGEGHIVNTSSRQGLVATPDLGPYPPAKHASVALTEMLRAELAALGTAVSTSVLTPGGVVTRQLSEAMRRVERGELDDPNIREFITSRVADAVASIDVGRLVVRAICGDRLYVNTHRETLTWLRERLDRIEADADALGTLR
ncbi:SDR family NAD(P)-dependent oxidoreductase [Frankia gtarii]|uniref:SDR family NAD(P)-dependent oxidoreductase n=1 Tax=Frankia gtarii TaxID=2950102 RepID=UPI0021BE036D|nr:SDR family NAD(P)-dependent oxidoreductase [Frankia gtarii]